MRKLLKKLREEKGFTLIEMTIVILVIAILLVVFLPNIAGVTDNVNKTTNNALKETVEAQAELYKAQHNEAQHNEAPTLEELKTGGYITEEQKNSYSKIDGGTIK